MQRIKTFQSSKTLLALYACVLIFLAAIVWWQGMNQPAKTNYPDFLRYYLFAQLINGAEGGKIYDHAAEQAVFDKFLGEPQRTSYTLITYPPTSAPFVFLLSKVPIDVAHAIWNVLGSIALFAGLFLLSNANKAKGLKGNLPVALIALGAVGSLSSARGVVLGQNMFFITAVIASFWWAFKTKRDLLTGLLLAVSSFKFQYSPFMLVAMLVFKRWKALGFAVMFEIVILGIATALMGFENITKYLFWMRAAEQNPIYFETVNQVSMICLRGLLSCFLPIETLLLSLPLFILGLAITGYLFYFVQKHAPDKIDFAIACSIICGLLFAPHVHMYDAVMLSVALVCTLSHIHSDWKNSTAAKIWFATLIAWPVLGWLVMGADLTFLHFHFGDFKMSVLTLWYHTFANLVLLGAGMMLCLKGPTSTETEVS